ncbi:MAG: hypothetical protein R3Y07_00285 [Eubacteriales bacterium]
MDFLLARNAFYLRCIFVFIGWVVFGAVTENYTESFIKEQSYDIVIDGTTITYPTTTIAELQSKGFEPMPETTSYLSKNPELDGLDWSPFAHSGLTYHGPVYREIPDYLHFQKGETPVALFAWNYTSDDLELSDTPVFAYAFDLRESEITIDGKLFEPLMPLREVESLLRGYEFFEHYLFSERWGYVKEYPYLVSYTYGWEGDGDYEAERFTYAAISRANSFGLVFDENNALMKVVLGKGSSGELSDPMDPHQDTYLTVLGVMIWVTAFCGFEYLSRKSHGEFDQ